MFDLGDPYLRDGEPCGHPGCLSHVSHPCESCGRIGGKANNDRIIVEEIITRDGKRFLVSLKTDNEFVTIECRYYTEITEYLARLRRFTFELTLDIHPLSISAFEEVLSKHGLGFNISYPDREQN